MSRKSSTVIINQSKVLVDENICTIIADNFMVIAPGKPFYSAPLAFATIPNQDDRMPIVSYMHLYVTSAGRGFRGVELHFCKIRPLP